MKTVTIKDIAKALNLADSTVSRALKGSYKISEETKKRVLEYASEHNFRPNLFAQSLKTQKSRSIGLVLCSVPNTFFAEVINGIEFVADKRNYHVIISQSHESYEREVDIVQHLAWRHVDGLLASISTQTINMAHFETLREQGTPLVFFDRAYETFDADQVIADNTDAVYTAITHLIEKKYTRIAHITSSKNISITQQRLQGYQKALSEHGMGINQEYIKYCEHGGMIKEEIIEAVDQLLKLNEAPDAIFCASDRITIGTFQYLKQKGIQIPCEIALTGFSNFSAPELFSPPLTTIKQPAFEMGKTAAELLIKLIESKRPAKQYEKIVLYSEFCIRQST